MMKSFITTTTLAVLAISMPAFAAPAIPAGCIKYIEATEAPKPIAEGFVFTEGPAWHPDGYFIFSDVPKNTLYKLNANNTTEVFQSPSEYSNGNTFAADGTRYTARHNRTVAATPKDGKTSTLIALYNDKKLNSPNDIIVTKDATIWFSDPDFGITGYGPEQATPEQTVQGVYRYKNGKLTLMISNLGKPNGLAFTPNGRALIVSDSATYKLYIYKMLGNGKLDKGKIFGEIPAAAGAHPIADGLKIDIQGNVWAAGSKSLGIFTPKAKLACRFPIEAEHVANLAFGGADHKDVLITAKDKIFKIRSKIAGK
jgi:gluconolactonase